MKKELNKNINLKKKTHKIVSGQIRKEQKSTHLRFKNINYLWLGLVLLLTIIAYSKSFDNQFITDYDDREFFAENPYIKNLSAESVKTIFTTPYFAANYIPLTTLSWAIEYHFFGLDPKVFFINNLILHLLNTILVFFLIYKITLRADASLISAVLFGIHPMHVESVTWLSERKDVLYAFFYLLSLIFYLKYLFSASRNQSGKMTFYITSLMFFILSGLAKSAAITLPLVMILTDYFYKRFQINNLNQIVKSQLDKIPFFIISVLIGLSALYAQKSVGAINALYDFNFADKIFLFTYSIMYYVINFIVPSDFAIIHYYPNKINGLLPIQYLISPVFIGLIILLIIKFRSLRREMIYGFLFFFIGLLLVVQFVPLGPSVVSERYTYIPYIGLAYIISVLYLKAPEIFNINQQKFKIIFIILFAGFNVFLFLSTYNLNKVWKNSISLFNNLVEKYPEHSMANYNLGYAKMSAGLNEEALEYFNKAIKLNSNYTTAYVSRGLTKHYLKKYEEEIPDYNEALRQNPNYFEAYNNRGTAKAMLKNYKAAIEDYEKALTLRQDYSTMLNLANAYMMLPDYKMAAIKFTDCLQLNPNDPILYFNRGNSNYNTGAKESACNDWQTSVSMGYAPANENIKKYCN